MHLNFKALNTELFIAKRIFSDKSTNKGISQPIVTIAIIGIALGLAVMILSVAIVTGFKSEISNKVIGFGSHIQIINYDANVSYETVPINKNKSFYYDMKDLEGVKHVQVFGTKAGIIKTKTDIQGVVLKGIGSDFDWTFFEKYLITGESFRVTDSIKNDHILISKYLADKLKLKAGDKLQTYFIQQPPRVRVFKISGIYQTNLAEFDEQIALIDIGHIQSINGWSHEQISGIELMIEDFSQLEPMTKQFKI
jgi:lipoprotein-releasing system permease protein